MANNKGIPPKTDWANITNKLADSAEKAVGKGTGIVFDVFEEIAKAILPFSK